MTSTKNNEVMKFVNVRGPQRLADVGPALLVYIQPSDKFNSKIRDIAEANDSTRKKIRERAIVLEEAIINVIDEKVLHAVRNSLLEKTLSNADAITAVQDSLGVNLTDLLKNDDFIDRVNGTWEKIYCRAVLGKNVDNQFNRIRATTVLESMLKGDANEVAPRWEDVVRWRPVIPKRLFPAIKTKEEKSENVKKLIEKVENLHNDMILLNRLEPRVRIADATFYRTGAGSKLNKIEIERKQDFVVGQLGVAYLGTEVAEKKGSLNSEGRRNEPPGNWLIDEIDEKSENLALQNDEKKYLKERRNLLYVSSELDGIENLKAELYEKIRDTLWMPKHSLPYEVATHKKTKALLSYAKMPEQVIYTNGFPAVSEAYAGTSERVHVLGIGDLIVVEEQIKRYEQGEIAHIENVMKSETRLRRHIRTTESENTLTTEVEESTEEEKSLQTTDRFELSRESQKELESSLKITAGVEISGSYGPVTVKANAGVVSSSSSSESNSTSQTIARESVSKAISKISKRVREEEVARILKRIEETNEHGFNNESGAHISGIYRWVDKYHVVRAVNYGRRLMLEMIVPEPSNGLRYAERMHSDEGDITKPPPPITFGPNSISRYNFLDYARIYKTGDVPPAPQRVKFVTGNIAKSAGNANEHMSESEKTITIPVGYKTTNIYDSHHYQYYGDIVLTSILAGSKILHDNDSSTLDGVVGSLTLSAIVYAAAFNVGVKVRCVLTDEAYDKWKTDVWDALNISYHALVAEYEEKLAARSISELNDQHGRHPERNKEIIRGELRRAAVKFLSEDMGEIIVAGEVRNNEQFNAADGTGDFNLPEAKIEGSIIQFFEQAFEWHNMTWALYPYFWANLTRQHEKLLAENEDPAMQDFLSAGAARVVVPVPIEYQDAVLNFFETNEIWNGGEPPTLDDETYVSILEELNKGQTNSFNSPIYYESANTPPPFIVDEWEVKLPTTLVRLQEDSELPSFPIGLHETNAPALLDEAVQRTGNGQDWRNSIVDLMTLYLVDDPGMEVNRRDFAEANGYSGNASTDAIASIDSWSYFWILNEVDLKGLDG